MKGTAYFLVFTSAKVEPQTMINQNILYKFAELVHMNYKIGNIDLAMLSFAYALGALISDSHRNLNYFNASAVLHAKFVDALKFLQFKHIVMPLKICSYHVCIR